jgi:hypothetical protein
VTPRRQLCLANSLIILGLFPFAAVCGWIAAFHWTMVPGQPPRVPIIDPIGMVGLWLVSLAVTAFVAGSGAVWSWMITRAYPELRSWMQVLLRLVAAASVALLITQV